MDTATRRQFLEALQKAQRVYRISREAYEREMPFHLVGIKEIDSALVDIGKWEVKNRFNIFTGSHAEYVLLSKDSDAVVELKDAWTLDEAIAFVFFDMNKVIYHSIVKKYEHVAKCDEDIEKVKQEIRIEKPKMYELTGKFESVKRETSPEFTFNFLKLFYDTKNAIIDDMKGSSKVGMLDMRETLIRPKDAIGWAKTNGYVVAHALDEWYLQQAAPSSCRADGEPAPNPNRTGSNTNKAAHSETKGHCFAVLAELQDGERIKKDDFLARVRNRYEGGDKPNSTAFNAFWKDDMLEKRKYRGRPDE